MERASAKTKPTTMPEEHRKPSSGFLGGDDEKPKDQQTPAVYASPVEELRAIYRGKTGVEISLAVERRIWETLEIRGLRRADFIEQLRTHAPNVWRNPAGFLTDFARKIGTVSTPAPQPVAPEPAKNGHGRCGLCNNLGRDGEAYCSCPMGRDLKAVEARSRPGDGEAAAVHLETT